MSVVTADAVNQAELERVLQKTLEASHSPLSTNQIARQLTGPFRRSPKELQGMLEAMADRGEIHRIGKYRGTERYWDRQPEEYARALMLEKLTACPTTRADLLRNTENELRKIPEGQRKEILRELVRSGAVQELPFFIGARSRRLSPRPADPRDYVRHALDKVREALKNSGISEDQVKAAAWDVLGTAASPTPKQDSEPQAEPVSSVRDLVLSRVMEIELGALVPLTGFRQGLDFQNRGEVDEAIWNLVRDEVVAVHKHHHPVSMSDAEREASLQDEQGNLYHAISRRS